MPIANWLPDFKGALVGFYDERLKDTIEDKSTEFKQILQENIEHGKKTQKALIAIAFGIFLLIAIYCFWREDNK